MKKTIFAYAISFIICLIFAYFELPVLRFDFLSLYVVLIMFFGLAAVFLLDKDNILESAKRVRINLGVVGIFVLIVLLGPLILSSPILHSNSYRNLIGDIIESDFTDDISPVSVNDIRLVDKDMATQLGDKKMGEIPGLGSVARLGEFHIQSVQDELFWVAPIVHRDFIKWASNLQGTTGYIMVSATNPQDVQFIQEIDNKPIQIVYQPDAFFHQDIKRHLYFNGFANVGMTDFTFEIDDNFEPYWVVTLYEHKIGFSGADAIGVATVHATTGEINSYSIDEAPSWIDRIQPEYFITSQLKDWGVYVNGFINSKLTEEGVLVPTSGTSLVYGDDGRSYWYTGMTSSGADASTVGFILVDTRTKEAKFYRRPGATEIAAMQSAEGKVQEKGYNATFPVMYNIYGTPTYVMSLKDKAGLIKMVAMVSVEDFSIVGLGDNKQAALRNYQETLASSGNNISVSPDANTQTEEGIITRFNADVQNGNTYYFFILDTLPDMIFTATSSTSKQVPLSVIGDKVRIGFTDYGNPTIDIMQFENLSIE